MNNTDILSIQKNLADWQPGIPFSIQPRKRSEFSGTHQFFYKPLWQAEPLRHEH
jgi:hypothetical protein